MELVELTETEKDQYNYFVTTLESGSFLQSWEWGGWQKTLGREIRRLKFKLESGEILGVVQLIKMPLSLGMHYWYAPYGPVMDLKFRIEDLKLLIQELHEKFSEAVFFRFEPKDGSAIKNLQSATKSSNIQPAKTLVVDLQKSEDQLLSEMHSKTRYNIKLAQKHGVVIKDEFDISIGNGLFAKEAVDLIVGTGKRQGYKGYGKEYYTKLIDTLAVQKRGELKLHIYKAVYQNKLLASAIMLDFSAQGGSASGGGTRTFLFGGSSDDSKNVMAPYLMHWQAMLDAKNQGLKFYDFWGIETSGGATPGFVRFKLGFGGIEKSYGGAYDIVNKNFSYKLYSLVRKLNRLF